ncbi:hypothetical protein ABIA65_003852 [Mycolicibacterium sp. 624]
MLACPIPCRHTGRMNAKTLFASVIDWLRAGYPEGVPGPDRVPLLALLRATPLTEDQVREIIRNITAADSPAIVDGAINTDEIETFISEVTQHDAGPENVERVAAKLAAAGWSVEGFEAAEEDTAPAAAKTAAADTTAADTKTGEAPEGTPPA